MNKKQVYSDQEEDKANSTATHLTKYSQHAKEHVNPLVHNKGCAKFTKEPSKKELFPKPPAPSAPTIPPVLSANPLNHKQTVIQKKESISSVGSDGVLSNTDEFNPTENRIGFSNFIKPPLFEVHNTMQFLLLTMRDNAKEELPIKKEEKTPTNNTKVKMPFKSRSMFQQKTESIEALAADLTPEQYNFLKKMYGFKYNYLIHALNMREIYFQYVSISKSAMSFTNSEEFLNKVSNILELKKNYLKDNSILYIQVKSNINKFITSK